MSYRKVGFLLILFFIITIAIGIGFLLGDDGIHVEQLIEEPKSIIPEVNLTPLDGDPADMVRIHETPNLLFYFRDSRDVLKIFDKRNGYTWKSGLDIPFSREVKEGLREGLPIGNEPIEDRMNIKYTGFANSLVTIEYYDPSFQTIRLASAAYEGVSSQLFSVNGDDSHFVLDVLFNEIDLRLRVHLYLTDEGYEVKVFYDEIGGADKNLLAAVILNPFLGASGGKHYLFDEATGEHSNLQHKKQIDGYVLVPDGPGALVHFMDNAIELKPVKSEIYGPNFAKGMNHIITESNVYKAFKNPKMPVYGIAHTTHQAAFIGFAKDGDAYMELIVMPEENTTYYTFAYPRFVYNTTYFQVFNQAGDSYLKFMDEINEFDIRFAYRFLAGDGDAGLQADYIGMALAYREYLLEAEVLSHKEETSDKIPMRLDFIMSDLKNAIIGHEHVIVTTANQVRHIIEELRLRGMESMNVGLYGWQAFGMHSGRPWQTAWLSDIGSKAVFRDLIEFGNSIGVDISFAQDYVNIHPDQVTLANNAIKHLNSWFLTRNILDDAPFTTFYYAKPQRAISWMNTQINELMKLGVASHTIEGISNILLSNHGDNPVSEEEAILLYQNALSRHDENLILNLDSPNMYLWEYSDRFLQVPMFPTMHLIQTESVPFLQMVLHGTMELFATYSNFSFFNQRDLLRLIDYNTFPSFVLTYEPAHYLFTTNALDYYSTGYKQFIDLMADFYKQINEALSPVADAKWTGRQQITNGVIKNSYDNGLDVLINFTDVFQDVEGVKIAPLSFEVVKRGGSR